MGAADAANWATIIACSLTALIALVGLVFWLTVIYVNGRATRQKCAKIERDLRAQANYLRKRARKSDVHREATNVRLENHELRLTAIEEHHGHGHGGTDE